MKPSDFILNSDYLSIAQVSSNTFTLAIGAGSLTGNNYTERNIDFKIRAQKGACDRILISKDGGRYYIGSYRQLNPNTDIYGFIQLARTSADNLRAKVVLENYSTSTESYPTMTFSIKVSSFRPPNVF